uniref:Uncharacterized protein n=1 Tax=Sphaerodactylus townsendi TaxID=933632 RepID=A0ACB8EH53_9SAUR
MEKIVSKTEKVLMEGQSSTKGHRIIIPTNMRKETLSSSQITPRYAEDEDKSKAAHVLVADEIYVENNTPIQQRCNKGEKRPVYWIQYAWKLQKAGSL